MPEKIIRYLGIGIEGDEDNYGDLIEPEIHLDITDADLDTPDDSILNYGGGIGRSIRTVRPGQYIPSGSITYAVDINTIAYILYLALGYGEEIDPEGDFTHEYNFRPTSNLILPAATFHVAKDLFIHQFMGTVINELTLSVDNEFAEASFDVIAKEDADGGAPTDDLSTLSLPDEYPLAFHEVTLSMADKGGTLEQYDVESLELTITNNVDEEAGIHLGSRFPNKMVASELEISLSLDVNFDGKDEIEDFWGQAGGPAEDLSPIEKEAEIHLDAGDDGELFLEIPRAIFENVATAGSGRDRLVQTIDVTTLLDTSADAEIIANLHNENSYDWVVDNTTAQ